MRDTLSTEIAALTGNEDHATLRAIDARVADLIGWWPENYRNPRDAGKPQRFDMRRCGWCECPPFTQSLDPTLAEIRRRGWKIYANDDGEDYGCMFAISAPDKHTMICRDDDNLTLAALEAMVRAVEGAE